MPLSCTSRVSHPAHDSIPSSVLRSAFVPDGALVKASSGKQNATASQRAEIIVEADGMNNIEDQSFRGFGLLQHVRKEFWIVLEVLVAQERDQYSVSYAVTFVAGTLDGVVATDGSIVLYQYQLTLRQIVSSSGMQVI